jgi:hypothetical protein
MWRKSSYITATQVSLRIRPVLVQYSWARAFE